MRNVFDKIKKSRFLTLHNLQDIGYHWSFLFVNTGTVPVFFIALWARPWTCFAPNYAHLSVLSEPEEKLAPEWRSTEKRDSKRVGGGEGHDGGQIQHGQQLFQQVLCLTSRSAETRPYWSLPKLQLKLLFKEVKHETNMKVKVLNFYQTKSDRTEFKPDYI